MIPTFVANNYKIIIPVIVLVAAVCFQDELQYHYSTYIKKQHSNKDGTRIFTAESLARYNGIKEDKMYMAVFGVVYDVSKVEHHYARGSPYHYFVGKDGSRALSTGDFKDESDNKDHVLDLSCKDFLSLLKWRSTFHQKYKSVGVLAGRYFGSDGTSTAYASEFDKRIDICHAERESDRKHNLQYPPCNIAWSEDEGTKVWCTKTSGGVSRNWEGVPRQLFAPGDQKPKCVCINIEQEQNSSTKFKEYENCSNTSVVCYIGTVK